MLIKYKDEVINLDNVVRFSRYIATEEGCDLFSVKFYGPFGWWYIAFESEEDRDKAMNHILNCYQWQREICTL